MPHATTYLICIYNSLDLVILCAPDMLLNSRPNPSFDSQASRSFQVVPSSSSHLVRSKSKTLRYPLPSSFHSFPASSIEATLHSLLRSFKIESKRACLEQPAVQQNVVLEDCCDHRGHYLCVSGRRSRLCYGNRSRWHLVCNAHVKIRSAVLTISSYGGYIVTQYPYMPTPPDVIAWSTKATDLGFVDPSSYASSDII